MSAKLKSRNGITFTSDHDQIIAKSNPSKPLPKSIIG